MCRPALDTQHLKFPDGRYKDPLLLPHLPQNKITRGEYHSPLKRVGGVFSGRCTITAWAGGSREVCAGERGGFGRCGDGARLRRVKESHRISQLRPRLNE